MSALRKAQRIINKRQGLSALPLSFRLFTSCMLCVIALCYASLILSIWQDTGMRIPLIVEGYGSMESIELTHHTFQYMYWFVGIFISTGILFLLTDTPEKIKSVFAPLVPALIFLDIGSTWLIGYSRIFAWVLFFSGLLLALSFTCMFLMIQFDLWFRRA